MTSLRLCVVMAVAIIGFAAAQTCSSTTLANAYSNNTLCTSAQTAQMTLCTCTKSTWNSTNSSYPFCTWSTSMAGNYTGVAACLATFSAAINTWVVGTLTGSCSNDFGMLHSCLVTLQASTNSLWNGTAEYTVCQSYASTVFSGTAGSSASSANLAAACPTPLSYTMYFTFGGNWSYLLTRTSRRARARAVTVFYTNVVNGIMADMAHATGYTPTFVSLQLTAAQNCLATIVMPLSQGAGASFVAVYGAPGAALKLFTQTSFWFSAGGGIGSFAVLGAGASPTPFTAAPTPAPPATPTPPTPSPSGASVATVAHVVLAVLALVLLA